MLRSKTAKESSKKARKPTDIVLGASEVILSTLQNTACLTPVPFLCDATTLAVGIINAAQGARGNKDALRRLGNDAGALVCAILSKESDSMDRTSSSRTLDINLEALVSTLKSIQKFAAKGASRAFLSRAMLHRYDLAKIQECRENVRQALDVFGLRSTIELHENVATIIQLVSDRRTAVDIPGTSQAIQEPRPRETQRREECVEGGNQERAADRMVLQRDLEEGRGIVQPLSADDHHPVTAPYTPRPPEPPASSRTNPFVAESLSASYSAQEGETLDLQPSGLTSSIPTPSFPPPPPHTNTNPFLDNPASFTSVSGNYSVVNGGVTNTNSGNTTTTTVSGSGNDSSVRIRRIRRR
ncbi:hypothetical protein Hypma_016168 [Hypsizygus marmoreus]|uniref:Uncharacterized protein n=1 Tax=Hypsizygus marmoreus TaxID=39966 RepID=A0A369J2U8_HYPMA|nr:hypothetical protein Hypma_016168 [Hypsizygus marmoreus]